MPLGTGEMVIILLIVVVVFGSTKLPALGDGLGRAIKNFKRSVAPPEELEKSENESASKDPARRDERDPKASG
jgi:sec-independent protein translocase protein TatA